ncbi:hypothetical protein [Rhodococcus pyridinivorans]
MLDHVELWDRLLRSGDIYTIRRVVLADDERGREMRNLSLLTVLLTESARLATRTTVRDLA